MRKTRRVIIGTIGFLALATLAAAFSGPVQAESGQRWYVISLGGTPVGYVHETVTASGSGWISDSAMVMVINRLGSRVELVQSSRSEEDARGRLLRTASETKASALTMKTFAEVKDRTIEIRNEAGGKEYVRSLPFTGELTGPEGLRRLSLASIRKPGDAVVYQTYAAELEKPASGKRTLLGREKVRIGGRDVEAFKTEEVLEGTGAKATAWLDEAHDVLRQEMPTPFGQAVYVLATREQALAAAGGASLGEEMFSRSILRTSVRLPRPRSTEALRVRLTRREDDGAWPDLSAPNQRVLASTGLTIDLEVRRRPAPAAVRLPPPAAEADKPFLAANSTIQSDEPALRAKVAEILRGETDTWAAALRLERWVAENMTFDAGIALAPSSELFRDRHGTCLGYATLLATMARAAGIPSRVVLGYVYVLGVFGGHAWTEVRVGEGWVPLDAAVTAAGPADAARVSVSSSSLFEGSSSLTGGAAARVLGQVGIRILGFTPAGGREIAVPEGAKPYEVEGDLYRNPWLGLSLAKPAGFAFGRLDAVWPDASLIELIGPSGARAGLQEGAVLPWIQTEDAAAAALTRFAGAGATRRESRDGRTVLIRIAGDKASAAVVDGPVYWLLTATGKGADGTLALLLGKFTLEPPAPDRR